jgi:hypothetical protein
MTSRSIRSAAKAKGRRTTRRDKLALGELDRHLGYFPRRLQLWMFQDFIETLKPMKVRPAQYSVLLVMEANPDRSQQAVGDVLGIERARLARMLLRLSPAQRTSETSSRTARASRSPLATASTRLSQSSAGAAVSKRIAVRK